MLESPFERSFKFIDWFLLNRFLFFPGDEEQKCQENEDPIKGDNTFQPLFIVDDIPEGKKEHEKSKENNGDEGDGSAGDKGHGVRLRIPYHASSTMMIKTMIEAVRYAQFSSKRSIISDEEESFFNGLVPC